MTPFTPETTEEGMPMPEQPVVPETAPVSPEGVQPEQHESESVPVVSVPETTPEFSTADPAIPESLVPQVQEYVNDVFEKGLEKTLEEVRRTGNAALIDALQAALAKPEIQKELKARGKVPSAPL